MGITIEENKDTSVPISKIPIGGTFKYSSSYYIKTEYEDEEEDKVIVFVNLLTGDLRELAHSVIVIPIELVMREKIDA